MTFNILDYLDDLEVLVSKNRYLVCKCPVCEKEKLKISLVEGYEGAYRCWSGGCSSQQIRESLGYKPSKNNYLSPFKKLQVSSPFKGTIRGINTKPLPIPEKLNFCKSISDPISSTGGIDPYLGLYIEETVFPYSKDFRVLRKDHFTLNGNRIKKEIYFQKREDNIWKAGVPKGLIPLYTSNCAFHQGDTTFFPEGEKVVEYIKGIGYSAISAASPCFNLESLIPAFRVFLYKYPNIKNIIFLPDNDPVGLKKCEIVRESCSILGLSTEILFLTDILQEDLPSHFDLADSSQTQLKIFLKYIERYD